MVAFEIDDLEFAHQPISRFTPTMIREMTSPPPSASSAIENVDCFRRLRRGRDPDVLDAALEEATSLAALVSD